jgi:hypothetical protein
VVRQKVLIALVLMTANMPSHSSAGDVWNIVDPTVSEQSRAVSASVLDGASAMFAALAAAERDNKISPEGFQSAASRLDEAANGFEQLAKTDYANRSFNADSEAAQAVRSWLQGRDSGSAGTVRELLETAAGECRILSSALRENYSQGAAYPNPGRTLAITARYTSFLTVGSLAAVVFEDMSKQ